VLGPIPEPSLAQPKGVSVKERIQIIAEVLVLAIGKLAGDEVRREWVLGEIVSAATTILIQQEVEQAEADRVLAAEMQDAYNDPENC
jgi:hypothetical protein